MSLFGLFSTDGCGGHHWSEWKDKYVTAESPIMFRYHNKVRVLQRQRRHCLHDGCDASERRSQSIGTVHEDALTSLITLHDDEVVRDLFDGIEEEDGDMIEHALECLINGAPACAAHQDEVDVTIEGRGPLHDSDGERDA